MRRTKPRNYLEEHLEWKFRVKAELTNKDR